MHMYIYARIHSYQFVTRISNSMSGWNNRQEKCYQPHQCQQVYHKNKCVFVCVFVFVRSKANISAIHADSCSIHNSIYKLKPYRTEYHWFYERKLWHSSIFVNYDRNSTAQHSSHTDHMKASESLSKFHINWILFTQKVCSFISRFSMFCCLCVRVLLFFCQSFSFNTNVDIKIQKP